jgi:hypothetical protein
MHCFEALETKNTRIVADFPTAPILVSSEHLLLFLGGTKMWNRLTKDPKCDFASVQNLHIVQHPYKNSRGEYYTQYNIYIPSNVNGIIYEYNTFGVPHNFVVVNFIVKQKTKIYIHSKNTFVTVRISYRNS